MNDPVADFLKSTYGKGRYLTGPVLSGNTVSFTPEGIDQNLCGQFQTSAHQAGIVPGGPYDESKRYVGSIAISLGDLSGLAPRGLRDRWDAIFCSGVIKKPGDTEHSVPVELTPMIPLMQRFAGHQFCVNPDAAAFACYYILRDLPLTPDGEIRGNVWHNHDRLDVDAYASLNQIGMLTPEEVPIMQRIDPARILTEYTWADCLPTLKQIAVFDDPQKITQDRGVSRLENPPSPDTFRAMQAGEGSFNDEFNFHTAPPAEDVIRAIEQGANRRLFFFMSYVPIV